MNLPNQLTVSRFLLTIAFVAAIYSPIPYHETIAMVLFITAAITDYYDGMIARRDKLITNFGILMDPLVDKILVCSAFIAFVGRGWLPAWMAVIIVARELAVTGLRLLAASKNVPSVRILRAAGLDDTHAYLARFGFDLPRHPKNFTMALGTGAVTPLQLAGAYAVFANGGYKATPYLISRVTDSKGVPIMDIQPPAPATSGERVLDERNVFITDSMMRDVARSGTGAAAGRLGRPDLAGKTGTTSDSFDGWFAGYGGGVVAVAWMGYDEPKSLGGREFGATLSLPIWMDYMRSALPKHPPIDRPAPEGVVQSNGDWLLEEYANDPTILAIDMGDVPAEGEEPVPADGTQQPPAAPTQPAQPNQPALQQIPQQQAPVGT